MMMRFTHHASERKECRLDLSHVAALKQVVGLKDVVRFETVGCEGFDKVRQVLQLQTHKYGGKIKNNCEIDAILLPWASSFCRVWPVSETSSAAVTDNFHPCLLLFKLKQFIKI